MKKIIINGKRNIEKIKGEKGKRKITENVDKKVFDKLSQVKYLNKLYLGEKFNGVDFIKKEVERKINGYKNQDIKKKKLNENKLISYEECLEKLVISKLKCYYCKQYCLLTYENVREEKQWTLDRLDNSQGHNNDNVVICCLKCNLKRRTTNDEKFKFSKQMRIIKTF